MIGGGQMGQRVRDTNWSVTPLGAYDTWPQSLRTSLSLVLNAKGIAALYWEPQQWLLYNDAYGEALGDRHPWAFGRPMPEVLIDIAPVLSPQVAEVLRTGEGFSVENLSMTMRRHGRDEETVWTYSFSPVQGEDGGFAGVLLLATEMTGQKKAERAQGRATARLETALKVAQLGTYEWRPYAGLIELDARASAIFGLPGAGVYPHEDAFARVAPDHLDRQRAGALGVMGIERPFDPGDLGRTVDFDYDLVHGDGTRRSILSTGVIIQDPDGTRRMVGAFNDVTDLRRAEAQLRKQNATLEQRVEERTAERNRIWQVSQDMLLVSDLTGVFQTVNPAWTRVLGWTEAELVGRTSEWLEHPEDQERTRAEITRLAESGAATPAFENRFRTRSGDYRYLSWTAVPEGDRFYCVARDVTEEKIHDEALRRYENIIQSDTAPICAFDTEYRQIAFNQAHSDDFFRTYGHRVRLGEVFPDLLLPEQASMIRGFIDRALDGEMFTVTAEVGDPDLTVPHWELSYGPLKAADGSIVGAFHHAKDVSARVHMQTELLQTQEALRQAQKMEAVGQLTGGLAHDFNNLLAGISGSLEMMQNRMQQGRFQDVERYMAVAQGASKRAAALTHRLLAFSRRQTLDPKPTDVNRLALGMQEMIQRTVGPSIPIEVVGAAGLWPALVDPSQLENALLNLCINARDAMPDGGRITVETANRWLDERASRKLDIPEGQYLSLCVTDTGTGMPPEVVARVFEPFFTTKPIGEGTGLGLSMIYGFAQQSGGQVRIYSEVDRARRYASICLATSVRSRMSNSRPRSTRHPVPSRGRPCWWLMTNRQCGCSSPTSWKTSVIRPSRRAIARRASSCCNRTCASICW
ncbi:histidine kinase [Methylorubrum sp. GM97]|nr:histidine kinase [Methylorubrum sp. GM97]